MSLKERLSSLNAKQALEILYNSSEYVELDRSLSASNAQFRDLNDSSKLVATYLLYLGQDNVLEDLWRLFYRSKPIGIDEYLSPSILGNVARQMYPIWIRDLKNIFSPESQINEYIIGGAIGCLTGDTRIKLLSGENISIKELADKGRDHQFYVYSYDIERNKVVPGLAHNAHLSGENVDIYKVEFTDGTVIRGTSDHPFLLASEEYRDLSNLRNSDSVKSTKHDHLVKSVSSDGKSDVYNLTVDGYENFAVADIDRNGIFTHNTGKTTAARIAQIYNLQSILNLREPQLSLGNATPDTTLVVSLFTVTLEKAYLAVLKPFKAILEICPLFQEVKKSSEFLDFEESDAHPYVDCGHYIQFPRNIMVYSGSQLSHALSYSMTSALLDESEFRRSANSIDEALALYTNLKERVRSRFLGSRFTFLCLVSSAKYSRGVIAEYTQGISKDPYALYRESAIWDVKHFDAYNKGHFYVLRGTQSHPSRILDGQDTEDYENDNYITPPKCKVIKVPLIYRRDFENRIEEALRNLAGEQTISADYLFDDLTRAQYDWLIPEIRLEAPMNGEIPLIHKMPKELFTQDAGGKRLARYPNSVRYLHIDAGEVSEAGIACCHKEIYPDAKVDENDQYSNTKYVIDFVAWIVSPDRINLRSIESLVIDLVQSYNVSFDVITTDQYQSSAMRQQFSLLNLAREVRHQSVDRSNDQRMAYLTASNLSSVNAIAMGKCSKAVNQLEEIQYIDGKVITSTRKDMADAIVGSLKNAVMNVKDQPMYPFVNLKEVHRMKSKVPDNWIEI